MGRRVFGPLVVLVDEYRLELEALGYLPSAVEAPIAAMRDLSRWLDREGVEPGELTGARLEEYLRARRAAGSRRYLSERSLGPLLGFLRDRAVIPPAPTLADPAGLGGLLIGYHDWLTAERDLAAKTVLRYHGTGSSGSGQRRMAALVSRPFRQLMSRRSWSGSVRITAWARPKAGRASCVPYCASCTSRG